jgi:SAM-dependent methyltransferase
MSKTFEQYADFYDFFYNDKNYPKEVDYVHQFIQQHRPGARKILEFGSGTGGHGRLLGEKGYEVLGIELSESMISKSLETENFTNKQGDITKEIILQSKFDVCLVLFHVFNYVTTYNDQIASLENINKNLNPGGLVAIEVWHGPAVEFIKPSIRIKRISGPMGTIVRIAEPTKISINQVDVTYQIFHSEDGINPFNQFSEVHTLRPTYPKEIDELASLTGFAVLGKEEFLTKNPVSEQTWSVIYFLQKLV